MIKYSALPIGEKLRLIRVAKGLSQENVAHATKSSISTISRIELGQIECSATMLPAIKTFLGVGEAPLFEYELKIYEDQLFILNDLADAYRTADARDKQSKMFPIEELPFERDLNLLYAVIDARLHFHEGNLEAGVAQLDKCEPYLDEACDEVKHIYYRNMGYVYTVRGDIKTAQKQYLRVLDFQSDKLKANAITLYCIGMLYFNLGQPIHAIKYLERAEQAYSGDKTSIVKTSLYNMLANCYTVSYDFGLAKKLQLEALAYARSIHDEESMSHSLLSLSTTCIRMGNPEEALIYIDEGLNLPDVSEGPYLSNHFDACIIKLTALAALKKHSLCQPVIEQAKALSKGSEACTIKLEATIHMMTISNKQSSDYLEEIAIPYFRALGGFQNYTTLEWCNALEAVYKKRGLTKKANAIAAITRDIYREMVLGPGD